MIQINTSLLFKILDETPSTQNIMLCGKHGIGKSQILTDYYSKKGYKVVTLFLGQMSDPGDLIGIPHKNEITGHTEFLPPYWFPVDDTPVVLFLDELNRARPEVLQTIMDLALNKTLAGKALPKGSRIISAVNKGEEYQITDLDPALVSRFNIYEFTPTVNDWINWAKANNIDNRIISFIEENGQLLDNFESQEELDNLEKTPDRRAWQKVSDIIKQNPTLYEYHRYLISGIVGGVAANFFIEYLDKNHIISAKDLLLGDFTLIKSKLDNYEVTQLAILNDSIFEYLETNNSDEETKDLIAQNINNYYLYLEESSNNEVLAHFANMFSGTAYPNSLVFIISECGALYSNITDFVKSLSA